MNTSKIAWRGVALAVSCVSLLSLSTADSATAARKTKKKPMKPTTSQKPTTKTDALFWAIRTGGFATLDADVTTQYDNLVATDGNHYRPGVMVASYPGPALRPVTVNRLTTADIASLDTLAKVAGLDRKTVDWGIPNTADVQNLVINYRGRIHSISSFGVGEESLTKPQQAARTEVKALLDFLNSAKGPNYAPTSIVLTARGAFDEYNPPGAPPPATVNWPDAAPPLGNGGGCQVLTRSAGKAAADLMLKHNEFAQYISNGVAYRVFARISFSGDRGCAPLM